MFTLVAVWPARSSMRIAAGSANSITVLNSDCVSPLSRQAAVAPKVQTANKSAKKWALPSCAMAISEPRPISCRDKTLARLATSRSSLALSHRKPRPRSRIPPSREGANMRILLSSRRQKRTSLLFGGGAKSRLPFDFGEAAGEALAFRIDEGGGAGTRHRVGGARGGNFASERR